MVNNTTVKTVVVMCRDYPFTRAHAGTIKKIPNFMEAFWLLLYYYVDTKVQ